MARWRKHYLEPLVAVGLLVGCSGGAGNAVGTAGQPCHPNGTCEQNLTCTAGVCTAPGTGRLPDTGLAFTDAFIGDSRVPTDASIVDLAVPEDMRPTADARADTGGRRDGGTGGCPAHTPVGSPCNDNDACTGNDVWRNVGGTCTCLGQLPAGCEDEAGTCGRKRVCDQALGCRRTYPGSSTSCDDGKTCTTKDHCNGLGACIGEPIATYPWRPVLEIEDRDPVVDSWSLGVRDSWVADQPVSAIRVRAEGEAAGYCYAWWGTAHLAIWALGGTETWCNLDNEACGDSLCQDEATFNDTGRAAICLGNRFGRRFQGSGERSNLSLTQGTTINFDTRHVNFDTPYHVACNLDVRCTD